MHRWGFALVGASLLFAAAILPLDAPPLALFACPFKAATGLPCLTCGCTHAFHFFVRGAFIESFNQSPLGLVLALLCALHLGATILGLRFRLPGPNRLRWPAVSLVALNWVFLVLRAKA